MSDQTSFREAMDFFVPVGIFFAIILSLAWYFGMHQDNIAKSAASNTIDSLIQSSGSEQPSKYFEQLSKLGYEICKIVNIEPGKLYVDTTGNGRFVLTMVAELGKENYEDLGIVGRRKSIEYISGIVWACGNQIKNVDKICVTLCTVDVNNGAGYDVELIPDISFSREWETFNDSSLINLVTKNMSVVHDTASGKQWQYKKP